MVFGLLIACVVQWTISLGLSEIASCFPSSGVSKASLDKILFTYRGCLKGQYHFVYILAPKGYKRLAAFVVGWMNLLGWTITLCSGVSVVVASISGMATFADNSFRASQGQLYFMYCVTAILSGKVLQDI